MLIELKLTVKYDEGDTSYGTLAEILSYMISRAYVEGCFTHGTDATLENYIYTIEEVKE